MDDAILLRTADRFLRRKYAGNVADLTAFADKLASASIDSPVTLTTTASEGGSGSGEITMRREIWLTAAEDLLADFGFNSAASPRGPRIIAPDYRLAQAV